MKTGDSFPAFPNQQPNNKGITWSCSRTSPGFQLPLAITTSGIGFPLLRNGVLHRFHGVPPVPESVPGPPVGKEVIDSIISILVEGCCALHPERLPSRVVCFGIHLTPLMFIGFCERSFGIQRQQSVPLPKIQQPDPRPYLFDSWLICRFERLRNPRCHGSMTPTCLVLVLPFRFFSHLVSPIPLTPVHMNVYEGMVRCVSIAPPF